MPRPFRVSKAAVRRFLLERQALIPGPTRVAHRTPLAALKMIRRLECVQLDPVAAVERSQHLVLAARLPGYTPAHLQQLMAQTRVFEYWANAACVIPIEDYPIFEGVRRRLAQRLAPSLERVRSASVEVLRRLEKEGPLPSRSFIWPDRIHGWWDNKDPKTKATSHALNLLWDVGTIMVVRRAGTERYFDLVARAIPAGQLRDAQSIEPEEADDALFDKYLRAFRIFDLGDFRFGWRDPRGIFAPARRAALLRRVEQGTVVPLEVEDIRRRYFALAEDVPRLRRHERDPGPFEHSSISFLPPLDNLLWRRQRVADFFDFEYIWEVYLPPARRRYGYYAMPILWGDRLIGRIDPGLDRRDRRLIVRLVQIEPNVRHTRQLRRQLRLALDRFAHFHNAAHITIERAEGIEGLLTKTAALRELSSAR